MSFLAGTIVNNVRDAFPDPIYSAGAPQPNADGQWFRASTLYRWLDDGCRLMVSRLGWTMTDWYAMPAVANQAIYAIQPVFQILDQAYANRLQCEVLPQSEARSVYPSASSGAQAIRAYVFRQTDHLEIGFDPFPNYADPATALAGAISATVTTIALASVTGWLPTGYFTVGDELIRYASLSGTTAIGCARAQGGTTGAIHADLAVATHCGLWFKGARVPYTISDANSIVDVPLAWVSLLNAYLLSMMQMSSQEYQVAAQLMTQFDKGCQAIAQQIGGRDPITRRLGPDRADGGVPAPNITEPANLQSSG